MSWVTKWHFPRIQDEAWIPEVHLFFRLKLKVLEHIFENWIQSKSNRKKDYRVNIHIFRMMLSFPLRSNMHSKED